MAKPNYSFEKRQRELAKKKKKEEKANRKSAPHSGAPDAEGQAANDGSAENPAPAPAEGSAAP